MKMVDTDVKETDNKNVVCVGTAIDSEIFYAALVDITSRRCYVEEIGLSQAKMGFTGIYRKIENDQEWQKVYQFFNAAGVFDKFLKGRNYHWNKTEGKSNIPGWFKNKFGGSK